jgi:hypothetical protein
MFKKFFIVLVLLLVALIAFIAKQPNELNVSKSVVINAEPAVIFAHINDFHKWNAWSPWSKLDMDAKTTFEGSADGVGSIMKWSSNNKEVGEGSMEITESVANELIKIDLKMTKPLAADNVTKFIFRQEGAQTILTWNMVGQKGFIGKIMGLFFNCEEILGEQFDKGLNNIKNLVELPVAPEGSADEAAVAGTEAVTK